jgi:lysophospholipase L1-like esterase
MTIQLKRNDTKDTISYTLAYANGGVVNLTGASVRFKMGKGNTLITDAVATVVNAATGEVKYTFTDADTLLAGKFNAEFEVTFSDGKVKTFPNDAYIAVTIHANVDQDQSTYIEDQIAYRVSDIQILKNSIQAQLDQFAKGDSAPEIAQSRVEADGTVNTTLKARLDKKEAEFTQDIQTLSSSVAQRASDITNLQSVKADKTEINTLASGKADKTYVDNQIANVMSGSPKGVYATLTALQTALPTGNSNIYLVTGDGKWYYWSGSAWVAGGTYQATGLAAGSVTESNVTGLSKFENINLSTDDKVKDIAFAYTNQSDITVTPTSNSLVITNIPATNGWLLFDANANYLKFNQATNGWGTGTRFIILGKFSSNFVAIDISNSIGAVWVFNSGSTSNPKAGNTGLVKSLSGDAIVCQKKGNDYYFTLNGAAWFTVLAADLPYMDTENLGVYTLQANVQMNMNNIVLKKLNLFDATTTPRILALEVNNQQGIAIVNKKTSQTDLVNTQFAVANVDGSNNLTLTKTGGSYSWTMLDTKVKQLEFTVKASTNIFAIANGTAGVIGIQLVSAANRGIFFVDNANLTWKNNVAEMIGVSETYYAAVVGDKVRVVVTNNDNTIMFYIKKVGDSDFSFWFRVDKDRYRATVAWGSTQLGFIALANGVVGADILIEGYANSLLSVASAYNNDNAIKNVNKKYLSIGDSITNFEEYQYSANDVIHASALYVRGYSGKTIPQIYAQRALWETDADIITVFAGTNDFEFNVAPGTVDSTNTAETCGALKALLEFLIATCPNAKIGVITPLQRWGYTSGIATMTNTIPLDLVNYVDLIKTVSGNYGIPVLDLYRVSGINRFNTATWLRDGLHPNKAGMQKIGYLIGNFIKSL